MLFSLILKNLRVPGHKMEVRLPLTFFFNQFSLSKFLLHLKKNLDFFRSIQYFATSGENLDTHHCHTNILTLQISQYLRAPCIIALDIFHYTKVKILHSSSTFVYCGPHFLKIDFLGETHRVELISAKITLNQVETMEIFSHFSSLFRSHTIRLSQ